jgi:hypothetical protein
MKKIIVLFAMLFIATPLLCTAKELKKQKLSVTPAKVIEAVFEVLTCTPENPTVQIVQVKIVNGRRQIIPINKEVKIESVKKHKR